MTAPGQPGWYDDENDPSAQRYWDGQNWTPHRQRKQASGPAPASVSPAPPPLPPQAPPPPPPSPAGQAQWPPPPTSAAQPQFPAPGGGATRRSRAPIVMAAAVAAVLVLVVAGYFGYQFFFGAGSDEDQIKALVATFTTDFNNADGPAIASLMCGEGTKTPGVAGAFVAAFTSETLRSQLNENGTASTSVANIHVAGNRATAQVTTTWSKSPANPQTETDSFTKENGTWKLCDAQG
jgi:Protein of unknown function (DUF2510)